MSHRQPSPIPLQNTSVHSLSLFPLFLCCYNAA